LRFRSQYRCAERAGRHLPSGSFAFPDAPERCVGRSEGEVIRDRVPH